MLQAGQLFPLYIAVRYIEFGTFFQRLDAAFLLIMNIAVCSFLGIYGNLCIKILKEMLSISDTKPLSYPFILLLYSATLLIDNRFELEYIQNTVFKKTFFAIIALGVIILILSNLKKKMIAKYNKA